MTEGNAIAEAVERTLELESELEASGEAVVEGDSLASARAELHKWIDTVVGVVNSPGVGRVMLIHDDGVESKISSPNLPFLLTKPAKFANGA